jgi:hypothetical protein
MATRETQKLSTTDTALPAVQQAQGLDVPKPHDPLVGANRVVHHARLEAVRYSALSAQSSGSIDTLPVDAELSGSTRFLRPKADLVGDLLKVEVTLIFRFTTKWPAGKVETVATIRATLEVGYKLNLTKLSALGEDDLSDFALCYGPFHAWGYWREFVQSSLSRLELPTVTAPLFRIEMAPKMVVERLD